MGDISWGGLKADEARDAAFLLTGAGTWVGKSAYLTANLMTIQEGKRAIAQTISDNRGKARGLGHPCVNCQPNSPSRSMPREYPVQKMCLEIVILTITEHLDGPLEAKNTIGDGESKGLNHLGFLHLPWTMVLRVIEVHCQQHLQCHPDQTTQMDQVVLDEVDNIEKKHA